jgi:single-stranded DNA-binding protein
VRIAGRLKDSSYERDGVTHYTTDRIVEEFVSSQPRACLAELAEREGATGSGAPPLCKD